MTINNINTNNQLNKLQTFIQELSYSVHISHGVGVIGSHVADLRAKHLLLGSVSSRIQMTNEFTYAGWRHKFVPFTEYK